MINILIIEEENADLVILKKVLSDIQNINILRVISTLEATKAYRANGVPADLIISAVKLANNCLSETFSEMHLKTPIIFMKGHSDSCAKKNELNCLDVLTKPIDQESIVKAIDKFRKLEEYFQDRKSGKGVPPPKSPMSRIIVRRGVVFKAIPINDIICFFTQNKVVYAVTKDGRKFVYDKKLSDLEQSMDPAKFFRINRQYVVNGHYINGFKNIDKIRIAIELPVDFEQKIIVSQDNAAAFRKWIYNSD